MHCTPQTQSLAFLLCSWNLCFLFDLSFGWNDVELIFVEILESFDHVAPKGAGLWQKLTILTWNDWAPGWRRRGGGSCRRASRVLPPSATCQPIHNFVLEDQASITTGLHVQCCTHMSPVFYEFFPIHAPHLSLFLLDLAAKVSGPKVDHGVWRILLWFLKSH